MKKSFLVLGLAWASTMTMAQSSAPQKKDTKPAKQSVVTARETGSGMATGRIAAQAPTGTHHDVSAQADVQTARETGSGMATGKTAQPATGLHQDGVIHRDLAAREATSGQAAGLAVQNPTAEQSERGIRESPTTTGRPHKTMAADDWNEQQKKNSMSGAQSNPLYQGDTKSGTNPLYESNSQRATKTRSNIQNNRVAAGDVTGDGSPDVAVSAEQQDSVRITKSRSNIQNNRVAAGDVNGDGVAEGVVKSKSNITNNREASADHSKASDASAGKGANDKKTAPRDAATGQASGKRQHN